MSKSKSPYLTRFLSDFTLGFSDGLTVPFALTAGLSSLGKTETVIYAGLAELCAGSISMGIGGYLAAQDEVPSTDKRAELGKVGDEEELRGMLHGGSSRRSSSNSGDDSSSRDSIDEKEEAADEVGEEQVRSHLEPLALPDATVSAILVLLRDRPDGLSRVAHRLQEQNDRGGDSSSDQLPIWPVASGLSISLGYVVGGIIPLFPYFFASTVGIGLGWSIAMCLFALMAFGSGKSWILRGEERSVRRALWEGMQMLVLGSLAAGAAVLCVNLVGAGEMGG